MTMTEGHLNDEEANFLAGVLGEPSGLGGILISAVHAKQATGQGGSSGKQHGGPKRSDAAGGAPPERPSVSQLEDAVADTMAAGAGPGSAALAAAAAPLARAYNEAAVAAMDGRRLPAAFELLQKAEALCGASGGGGGGGGGANGALDGAPSARDRWAAATANNLGCYYQRKAKPEAALHYLQRCAELEGGTGGAAGAADAAGEAGTGRTPDDDASTLLNLCAVLGSLGRHEQALPHAEGAVETLCGAVGVDVASLMAAAAGSSGAGGGGVGGGARPVGGSSDGAGDAEASSISSGGGGGGGGSTSDASRVWAVLGRAPAGTAGLLCMALYNRAVEMEHLGRLRPALTVYRAASALAGRLLPSSSPLRTQFARTLSAFKARLHAERVSEQQQHAAAGAATTTTGSSNMAPLRSASSSPGTSLPRPRLLSASKRLPSASVRPTSGACRASTSPYLVSGVSMRERLWSASASLSPSPFSEHSGGSMPGGGGGGGEGSGGSCGAGSTGSAPARKQSASSTPYAAGVWQGPAKPRPESAQPSPSSYQARGPEAAHPLPARDRPPPAPKPSASNNPYTSEAGVGTGPAKLRPGSAQPSPSSYQARGAVRAPSPLPGAPAQVSPSARGAKQPDVGTAAQPQPRAAKPGSALPSQAPAPGGLPAQLRPKGTEGAGAARASGLIAAGEAQQGVGAPLPQALQPKQQPAPGVTLL